MIPTFAPFRTAWLAGVLALSVTFTGASAHAAPGGSDETDLSALLKRQTQEFSDAGQKGDAATIDRLLDSDVVFTNETGAIATKKDLVDGASPPPPGGPKREIEVTNWALRRQGEVATATFIDQLTQHFGTQTLVVRFQSTETWAKRPDGWKMIASQTMNVQTPPPAVTLPAAELDAYVGVYQVDPTYVVTISRDAAGLTASANGGPSTPLKVEIKDVLFTDASPNVRKLFQRDTAGHVVGYINRRDGVDLVFRKVS